jgi:small subunit ribosomal protein S15
MIDKSKKNRLIKKHQVHESDTGSSEVQVAILTKRITELTDHLKTHKKDNHSRRGLLQMVAKRKKLLKFLEGQDLKRYEKIVKSLKLKAAKSFEKKEEEK